MGDACVLNYLTTCYAEHEVHVILMSGVKFHHNSGWNYKYGKVDVANVCFLMHITESKLEL